MTNRLILVMRVTIVSSSSKKNKSIVSPKGIYVRSISGYFSNIRFKINILLMFTFFALPYLKWNDRQAILLDIIHYKFYFFDLVIWPQDFLIIAFLFILAAFLLFFFTTYLGRVWCGYLCPQSVWTFIFIWFEEKIEGNRNKRIALDKQKNDWKKIKLKIIKHSCFMFISFITAYTFISYFIPSNILYYQFFNGTASSWIYFWIILFTFCTYGNAAWMREIMCTHICPYARFQSVMFDSNTITVSYDAQRGEQRGPRKRHQKNESLGDCIDCNLCVQVCPTGIDIRNGLQYECINCGACVDACDNVMEKMKYPKGLIRYTTENALNHKKSHILRPKLLGYALVSIIMISAFVYMLSSIKPVIIEVSHDRNALYRVIDNNKIENVYIVKIINKTLSEQTFNIEIAGLTQYQINLSAPITIDSGEVYELPITINSLKETLTQSITPITFNIISIDNKIKITQDSQFFSSF